ncbi:Uncharacterised protein [Klebsiella pneumoniae]|nr:Uncharacterised protein [Klebsiella pneumoniae]SWS46871.1 Uncharacterised protein [Klebsiella pneumoniae]SYI69629.1 Uncharacterised protein [Klebsiella pneumoniae]
MKSDSGNNATNEFLDLFMRPPNLASLFKIKCIAHTVIVNKMSQCTEFFFRMGLIA